MTSVFAIPDMEVIVIVTTKQSPMSADLAMFIRWLRNNYGKLPQQTEHNIVFEIQQCYWNMFGIIVFPDCNFIIEETGVRVIKLDNFLFKLTISCLVNPLIPYDFSRFSRIVQSMIEFDNYNSNLNMPIGTIFRVEDK